MRRSQLNFRCDEQLKKLLETTAKNNRMTLSAWALSNLKAAAEGRPVYDDSELSTLREIIEQFRRAAINLNQLVRTLHIYSERGRAELRLPDPNEWSEALRKIDENAELLRRRLGL